MGFTMASATVDTSARTANNNWIRAISNQVPWDEVDDPLSLNGAAALPMPVFQSDKASLAPFFAHLSLDGTHGSGSTSVSNIKGTAGVEPFYNTELIEFEKGVLYADGRIDLCKMVTGPRNIGDLMQSLKLNTFSKHFLLGNNIIGPTGAKAIVSFVDEFPNRFETWYLAGNCVDGASFKLLVDSMVKSTSITNIWLKRNPLRPDAVEDIFHLITETRNLRTLELDQTGLGDAGVAHLFELLAMHVPAKPLALRNLYLNACGIGENACERISRYLQSTNCTLDSLYVSNNPIGKAASILANGLKVNNTLKRLVMQSCGLKDDGIIVLANALNNHPSVTLFDIGQSYSTSDLGMRYNWATDESTEALADLVENSKLEYLDVSYTLASQASLTKILKAVASSDSLVWFHVKPLTVGAPDAVSVKAGQMYARLNKLVRQRLQDNVKEKYHMDYVRFEREVKRFLVSPRDVRFIDSVYRNRDAAAARLGLKKLDKWWDADDETLERVRDGTLGEGV